MEAHMRRQKLLAGLALLPFLAVPLIACDDPPGPRDDPATLEARALAARVTALFRAGDRDGAARFAAEHATVAVLGDSAGVRASARFVQEGASLVLRERPEG